ncbi:hypothetical protein KK137_01615 [Croceibacterium sp. LX-88]|uniref:Uncharacterized protein n=1 Tax=Croceibacterium selenioxidans TaxID=2838833 RepID=A0ABS5W1M7_9SPHN|nr:hypothetical protein [Croceibacterium selenioxidans]MBT2133017.1 hypothetical protein [Croceibacterium selenioxidans]
MIIQFHKARAGKHLVVLGALASAFLGTAASAAPTQGTLGATSTGIINISASVANRARITGLADVTFSNVDPSANASANQSVCVWSNTATKAYTITATGSGGSGSAFTLGTGTPVPYTVQWAATSGQTTGTALTAGTASATMTSGALNQTCSVAPTATASLIITIASTDLLTMSAGTAYNGTLTLLVTPQ